VINLLEKRIEKGFKTAPNLGLLRGASLSIEYPYLLLDVILS
jgi:hypothetical protein